MNEDKCNREDAETAEVGGGKATYAYLAEKAKALEPFASHLSLKNRAIAIGVSVVIGKALSFSIESLASNGVPKSEAEAIVEAAVAMALKAMQISKNINAELGAGS